MPMKSILNEELEKNIVKCSGCLFTENYIINKTSYWIINYNDILLISKQLSMESGGQPCTRLYMATKNGNYSFVLYSPIDYESNYKLSEQVYQHIKNKNPDILIGNTKKNKMLLENHYNIKLPKRWKSKAKDNE